MQIEVKYDVGTKLIRTKYPWANVSTGSAKPIEQKLIIEKIEIENGGIMSRQKRRITYMCFNEDTGKFENISEDDMNEHIRIA